MDWIQNLLNGENGSALQLVLITLLLVIGLILIVWVVRRIAGSPARRAGRGRIPRLLITDSAAVDDKRYIVLVRRDNVEHLLLIGGPTDVVVETGIVRVQPVSAPGDAMRPSTPSANEKTAQTPKKLEPKPTKEQPLFGSAAGGAAIAAAPVAAAAQSTPPSAPAPMAPETKQEADPVSWMSFFS